MKFITSKIVTLVLLVALFIGVCILLYPSFSQYWNSKVQSKILSDYQDMLENMNEEDFSAFFEEADRYNRELAALPYALRDYEQVEGYSNALNVAGTGLMGYLSIDKIRVQLPIYHGTDKTVLATACGHLKGSSLPVGGEGTHAVLSAHRGLPAAKLFTDLDKLQIGDVFTVTIYNKVLTYQVDMINTVKPSEVSLLESVPGEDHLTLLTCTPYGINTHRLLVRGTRIETVETKKIYVSSEAFLVDRLIVTPIVALPILLALIIYVVLKPTRQRADELEEDSFF